MTRRANPHEEVEDESWLRIGLRFLVGLVVLFAIVWSIGHFFADEARGLARGFVTELGLWGLGLGTFLADGVHFPVPPQFYMFLGISAGTSELLVLSSIAVGSVLGGALAFWTARAASRFGRARRFIDRVLSSRLRVGPEHPYRFVVASSLTPVPFAWLCYATGFSGFSTSAFLLLAALRLPKLLVYYGIVRAGWAGVGGP